MPTTQATRTTKGRLAGVKTFTSAALLSETAEQLARTINKTSADWSEAIDRAHALTPLAELVAQEEKLSMVALRRKVARVKVLVDIYWEDRVGP